MTFYISPSYDKHYSCQNGHNNSGGATHVDRQTWSCTQCHHSLDIDMTDSSGVTHTVQRHPANTIRYGDQIVWDRGNKHLNIGRVRGSHAPTGKQQATHWKLVVEGYGPATVPTDQYINRI